MAYITQSDIAGQVPAAFLLQALDDDGDGLADAGIWDGIVSAAQNEIDGRLAAAYSVPFSSPVPALIKAVCSVLALWLVYKRRGITGAANPWDELANKWLDKLNKVGEGKETIDVNLPVGIQGVVLSEASRLFSESNSLLI